MPTKLSSNPRLLENIDHLISRVLLEKKDPLVLKSFDPMMLEQIKIAQFFAVVLCKIKLAEMEKPYAYPHRIYCQQAIFINIDTNFDCSLVGKGVSKRDVLLKVKENLQSLGITMQVGIGYKDYCYPHSILITGNDGAKFLTHVDKFTELLEKKAYEQAERYIWFSNIKEKITQLKADLQQEIVQLEESKLVFFKQNQIKVKRLKYAFLEKLGEHINKPIVGCFSARAIVKEVLDSLPRDQDDDLISQVFEGVRSRVKSLTIEFLGEHGKQRLAGIIKEKQGKLPLAAQFRS